MFSSDLIEDGQACPWVVALEKYPSCQKLCLSPESKVVTDLRYLV